MRTFAALIVLALGLSAQTSLTTTNLGQPIPPTLQNFLINSSTGITMNPPTSIYVDGELMLVLALDPVGPRVTVARAQNGTQAQNHSTAATVYVGPSTAFGGNDVGGACTSSSWPYTPYIAVNTGNKFVCSVGQWVLQGGGGSITEVDGTTGEISTTNPTGPTVTVGLASALNLTSKSLRIPNSSSLPGTCSPGNIYYKTDSTTGYFCSSANTWSAIGGVGLTSLNGLTASTQTFTNDTNVTIVSGGTAHVITWAGQLGVSRGGTGLSGGTSGGIPYFSGASTIASSGALTANLPVFGGGAGVAPFSGTVSGNTTKVVTLSGATVSGNCAKFDASGNLVDNGSTCANVNASGTLTANQLVIGAGTTNVQALGSLGTTSTVLHGNAGGAPTFGAVALGTDVSGTLGATNGGTGLSSFNSGGVLYSPSTSTVASSPALTSNLPLIGGGAGNPPTTGTVQGNTTKFVSATGSFTSGNLTKTDANGNLVDNGTATVPQGGTGATTLTNHGVLIGQSTSAVAATSAGTAGQVLTSNGPSADPTFQASAGGASYGAFASLPGTCSTGQLYTTSDSMYTFQCTATNTWTVFYKGTKCTLPPTSSWSWNNQNSSTASTSLGTLSLRVPQANGTGGSLYYRTQPSTPYTITFTISQLSYLTNFMNSGIAFYESGTGKMITLGYFNSGLRMAKWTSPSAVSSNVDYANSWPFYQQYFRLSNDGTTIKLQMGDDPVAGQWYDILSEAKATFFTTGPDSIGLFYNKNNSNLTYDYLNIYCMEIQ